MARYSELEQVLGPERVLTDRKTRAAFASDGSFVSGKTPGCVVCPKDADQILALVRLANERSLALIPCSSRPPRFRGDTLPAVANAVMVDLSGLDRIVRIDRRAKVALIEPGVTFEQLQTAAHAEGLRVVMPLLPRRTKSVIGAYLEREPNTIPKYHWDMSDPLCCLEVVFGAGELFRTGSAAGPGSLEEQWAAKQAQKSPMGPNQTDFMKLVHGAQGSMGIVSWATVKLELLPAAQKAFLVGAADLSELIAFTSTIVRPRWVDEVLILNRLDLACIASEAIGEIDRLRESLPEWMLLYTIAGYHDLPQERVAYLELDIGERAGRLGITPLPKIGGVAAARIAGLLGRCSDEPYWKLRLKGACQDIFFITTLNKTREFVEVMREEAERCRFPFEDIGVYVQPIQQGRNVHLEFNLLYDAHQPAAVRQARALFEAASRRFMDMGGFFNRPYGLWSELAYARCPDTVTALRKVKSIFDPNGIMNPGKLCFTRGDV